MGRQNKPWLWVARNAFYVTLNGRRIRLGATEEEAWDNFRRLTEDAPEAKPERGKLTIDMMISEYLDYYRAMHPKSSARTTETRLKKFREHFGKMTAPEIRRGEVEKWSRSQGWSNTTINGVLVVLGVFFNWCVSEKLINENPIKRIKRPTPTRRNAYMTEEDITRIIEAAKPDLALVVKFLADTGIRPQLVEKLCAADINWDEGFAMGFSKGAPYKIYLPKWWLAKLRELASQYPTGPLFRPMVTDKWTPKNIKDRLAYVTKRLNINKCAYSIRHGFATRMLAKGVSVPVVAQLLNHADWKMISKVYSHIDKMSHLMREAIEE